MAEKLTETIGIKLSDTALMQARGVAESQGLGLSEWVRSLIEAELERERVRFHMLATVFHGDQSSK